MSKGKENKNHGWQTLSSRVAYKNPWMQVREDKIVRPDGSRGMYGIVETAGPAVYIIALTEHNEVFLIHQYRYAVSMYSWELPAGGSEGQNPLKAAKRELQEETGLTAKKWRQIATLQTSNGLFNELMYIYLAQNLTQTHINKQSEDGIIEVKAVPITETLRMIKDGLLTDSQTVSAISHAILYLDEKL